MSDYLTFKVVVAIAIVVAAFIAGLLGFIGPTKGARNDKPPE